MIPKGLVPPISKAGPALSQQPMSDEPRLQCRGPSRSLVGRVRGVAQEGAERQ